MNENTHRCPKCEQELPVSRFNLRANGRCYAYCKACQSLYARNHYLKNAVAVGAKTRLSTRQYRIRNRMYVIEHLRQHPCVDCGEADPVVLDFDHRDRSSKTNEISNLTRQGFSLKRLKREMDLCDIRCARCHRLRTARDFAWKA